MKVVFILTLLLALVSSRSYSAGGTKLLVNDTNKPVLITDVINGAFSVKCFNIDKKQIPQPIGTYIQPGSSILVEVSYADSSKDVQWPRICFQINKINNISVEFTDFNKDIVLYNKADIELAFYYSCDVDAINANGLDSSTVQVLKNGGHSVMILRNLLASKKESASLNPFQKISSFFNCTSCNKYIAEDA
jgi:hypothetical protein